MTALNTKNITEANKDYMDLYGSSLSEYVQLPVDSSFTDIIKQANTNNTTGYSHRIMIGDRCIVAERKYTWSGRVAKTAYLHIYHVSNFESMKTITHWREQKNGTFKTI